MSTGKIGTSMRLVKRGKGALKARTKEEKALASRNSERGLEVYKVTKIQCGTYYPGRSKQVTE